MGHHGAFWAMRGFYGVIEGYSLVFQDSLGQRGGVLGLPGDVLG